MAPVSSVPVHRIPDQRATPISRSIEWWLSAACVGAIGLMLLTEVVRTAPPDAPVAEASFDAAPSTWTLPVSDATPTGPVR